MAFAGWIRAALRGALPEPINLAVVAPPDGAFKAVLASWNGGGAIALSCDNHVFAVPTTVPINRAIDDETLVLAAESASFEDHSGSPSVFWRGPRTLFVRLSTSDTLARAILRLRRFDADRQVKVEFEVSH